MVMLLPFLKSFFSSVERGTTLTPVLMIFDFSFLFSASSTIAQPIDVVPKSSPKIRFILMFYLYMLYFYLSLFYNFEAIHNKDYSVVKTFKAALIHFGVVFYVNYL